MTTRTEKARLLLTELIEEADSGDPENLDRWRESARVALQLAPLDDGPATLERFDNVRYSPGLVYSGMDSSVSINARRRGVRRATEILRAALLHLEVDREAPSVDVAGLHPWVSGNANTLWNNGHHRQAVEEAARAIEVQLRAKLGLHSGTGTSLVSAFGPNEPKEGHPRLRFAGFEEGSDSWRNAHQGAMAFGQGCMMRIRNLYTHRHDPTENEALEALTSLSLLARWVEEADVVGVEN